MFSCYLNKSFNYSSIHWKILLIQSSIAPYLFDVRIFRWKQCISLCKKMLHCVNKAAGDKALQNTAKTNIMECIIFCSLLLTIGFKIYQFYFICWSGFLLQSCLHDAYSLSLLSTCFSTARSRINMLCEKTRNDQKQYLQNYVFIADQMGNFLPMLKVTII